MRQRQLVTSEGQHLPETSNKKPLKTPSFDCVGLKTSATATKRRGSHAKVTPNLESRWSYSKGLGLGLYRFMCVPCPPVLFELRQLLPVPGATSKYIIDILSDPPEGLESEGIFIKSECLQNGWSIGWILMQDYSCLSTIYYSALFIHIYVIYIHTHRHTETH